MVHHCYGYVVCRLPRLPALGGATMIPATQSRIGERGTCFRACLASILNLREDQVSDFPDANQDAGVDRFLRRFGLRYDERPIDRDDTPTGWHVILGESPRGGEHAVVGYNGIFRHDPHPIWDDRRRGLVDEKAWGELLPLDSEEARDSKAAEALRTRHDEIVSNHLRGAGSSAETAYNALYRPTVSLVHDAEVLLTKTRLDDDPAYWHRKLESAQDHLDEAVRLAKSGKYGQATSYLDAALTMAHMVIDKMRKTGSGRARDNGEYTLAEAKAEASYSCAEQPTRVKDMASEAQLTLAVERAKKRYETARGAVGLAEEARKRMRGQAGRLQSPRESKARTKESAAYWEVHTAERALKEFQDAKAHATDASSRRERLHRALDHVLDAKKVHTR